MSEVNMPEVALHGYRMNRVSRIVCGTALAGVFGTEIAMLTGHISPNVMLGACALTVAAVGAGTIIDERARNCQAAEIIPASMQQPVEFRQQEA
ncbi:MAG: hypothetical protein ABIQ89_01795 [Candidatus Saccharimonadales bacterium]